MSKHNSFNQILSIILKRCFLNDIVCRRTFSGVCRLFYYSPLKKFMAYIVYVYASKEGY